MAVKDDYLEMQKKFYNSPDKTKEQIVGSYNYHENFPYETYLLYKFGDVRKPLFDDYSALKAFDVACGEGRMIRRMSRVFGLGCDGADISQKMVSAAREQCPGSNVYVTDGRSCGDAATDSYDFGFCTISLQHIASYEIRSDIIKDLVRILKPGGKVTLQLLMSEFFPYTFVDQLTGRNEMVRKFALNNRHAGYFEDKFDAASTNSDCDNVIGINDIPKVVEDFKRYFESADVWFHDISIGRALPNLYPRRLDVTHPNSHLTDLYHGTHFVFLHGEKPIK